MSERNSMHLHGYKVASHAVPRPELPEQSAKLRSDELRRERAFGRLPDVVALHPRVGPEPLILLAFRSPLAGYSLGRKI